MNMLEQVTPQIDSHATCDGCAELLVWDECWGWMHTVPADPGQEPHPPQPKETHR